MLRREREPPSKREPPSSAALVARRVTSRAALVKAWDAEPRYLLRELAALLSEQQRAALVQVWPKVLVLAEREEAKRRKSGPGQ